MCTRYRAQHDPGRKMPERLAAGTRPYLKAKAGSRTDARIRVGMGLGLISCYNFDAAPQSPGFAAMLDPGLFEQAYRVWVPRVFCAHWWRPVIMLHYPAVFEAAVRLCSSLNSTLRAHRHAGRADFFSSVLLNFWRCDCRVFLTATTPPLRLIRALRALRIRSSGAIVMLCMLCLCGGRAQSMMRSRPARSASQ